MIKNFMSALAAEHIKKRGTGLYVVAAIVGAFLPIARLLIKIFVEKNERFGALPINYFQGYVNDCLTFFAAFFFPLVIIISVSRITQLDHKNGGWQLMETQPLHKFSIYFSKFLVVLTTNAIAIFSLLAVSMICASLGLFMEDTSKLDTSIPILYLIKLGSRLFIASLFITALQFFIAVLMSSFIWSMLIGFFLFMITGILTALDYIPDWYPYEILSRTNTFKDGSDLGYWFIYTEYASLFIAILLLCLGFQWFKFKQFKAAFFGNSSRMLQALAVLILIGGMIFYTLTPNQMRPHTQTVLAGKIESDNPVKFVFVVNKMIRDTLMKIPVVDGAFRFSTKDKLILDNYSVEFDNGYKQNLFFGANDSVFIDLKLQNNQAKFKATGTRLAENQSARRSRNFGRIEYYLEDNRFLDQPSKFSEMLYKEWEENSKQKDKNKTVDNYVARADYRNREQKLNTINYLNFWEQYVEKRTLILHVAKTAEPSDIKLLRKELSLTDESLLSDEGYFKYVLQQLTKNDTTRADINLKQTNAILKLKNSSFRDKMLYWQLEKIITLTDASDLSKLMIEQNSVNFLDKKYANSLVNKYNTLQRLRGGVVAPLFNAVNADGNSVNVSAILKGKFNVIMVWASWNRQSENQSYYFENSAIKFANKNIQFVALSVDEKMDTWKIKAKKTTGVLQLHASDIAKLSADYNLETMPRFILIDNKGNFVNAYMPSASEKGFEMMIKKVLKLSNE